MTEEQRELFIEMYRAGKPNTSIAAAVGIHPSNISRFVRKFGIPLRQPQYWKDVARMDELRRDFVAGVPTETLTERYGLQPGQIKNFAWKRGWRRPPWWQRHASLKGRLAAARIREARRPPPRASDDELIAEFISKNGVRRCPPGAAAGLTSVEREFWPACPEKGEAFVQSARRGGRARAMQARNG